MKLSRNKQWAFSLACIVLMPLSGFCANIVWKNSGTNWNSNGSWTGSNQPTATDVAVFDVVRATNPNLSASVTIQELNFSTTASSNYTLTSSTTAITLTLTNTGTGTTSAINAANTSGTNTISAPIVLGAGTGLTQTFTQAAGGTLILNGVVSSTNTVTLAVAGAGSGVTGSVVQLNGANTYTGGTQVNTGGTLLVNNTTGSGTGTGTVTVNSGATLGGTGTISGAVSVTGTGKIDAGPVGTAGTAAAVGTLHTGALTLASTSTFHADAFGITNATQWDHLVVGGTGLATLGSATFTMNIASGLTFIAGTVYTLIDATTLSGTFAGYADNTTHFISGYTFVVHYDQGGDGNFELTAVPEPSTWVAGCLAILALAFTQRRQLRELIARRA